MIAQLPLFIQLKGWLVSMAGVTADAMHIYMGIICYLISITITKSPMKIRTLLPVFVTALGAEMFDLYYDSIGTGVLRRWESVHDFVHTTLVPVLIFILLRLVASAPSASQRDSETGQISTPR